MPRIDSAVGLHQRTIACFIARDNAGRDRGEERFGERFLQGDLFVKTSIFQHGRDVVAEEHQRLETLLIERLTGEAMAEKKPAADSSASVQRHDHFRADSVERAPEKLALRMILVLRRDWRGK